jgi:hypothetical protein
MSEGSFKLSNSIHCPGFSNVQPADRGLQEKLTINAENTSASHEPIRFGRRMLHSGRKCLTLNMKGDVKNNKVKFASLPKYHAMKRYMGPRGKSYSAFSRS